MVHDILGCGVISAGGQEPVAQWETAFERNLEIGNLKMWNLFNISIQYLLGIRSPNRLDVSPFY